MNVVKTYVENTDSKKIIRKIFVSSIIIYQKYSYSHIALFKIGSEAHSINKYCISV